MADTPRAVISVLAGPSERDRWRDRALCAQTDPEVFFPVPGGSTRAAKRVCMRCEVRSECLDYALAHDERFGVWGGLSERARRRLRQHPGAEVA
ncbi:WhiB family transcriptional regulator [Candidatus Mycobacterium methanotrophicum]|uniref:Transcriptional regulator WhiB n=1 Tax=Candidatus Mycobacterium methanotrophicum TaxID=2943498 RepID=A0ABY4QUI1_9MYCO|nr:WhiB family transcriptional regulator [Candidatus Mycobacterium methanotrophicum]UQX13555.1 WhiB family transcriptional regulator [Candidatus Mycobacterium methanotrophicum]